VSLVRSGGRDVLLAAGDAVPATVEIAFEPYTRLLIADYVPVLAFSDGGRALFTGVFEIGVADLEALATDEDPLDATLPLAIDFVDAGGGPVLVDGRLLAGGARFDGPLHTYAYFGTTEPVRTDRLVLLLDEAIPEWIRSELESFLPALMDLFTRRLGAALPEPPTIYAVWDGAEHRGHSQGGSVMAGFLAANFGGRGLLRPDADALARLRTFYAHEAAHFWNGGVVLPREREHAWVSEGGADWLAIRAMAELVPSWDAAAARRGKVAACRDHGGGAALNAAEAENRHDASYACGALAHALAERSLAGAGQSTFDLWAEVLRRGEAEGGEYDMETWLGALEDLGGDGELAAMLRRWAEEGLADGEFASATALANRHPSRGSEGSNRR
jgi:hypothetical protein